MATRPATAAAGEIVRTWRQRRKLSQFELSLQAAISSRHLSFVETGRARPSREMLLHLSERLEMPLRDRNGLLLAAGYAPVFDERPLHAPEMTPVRTALDHFLRAHEPFPAVILDRHYNLVGANDATQVLLEDVSESLLQPPVNALRLTLHPQGMAPRIENLDEWSAHLLHRLRRQAAVTGDEQLERLHDELAGYPEVEVEPALDGIAATEIVLPLRLRVGKDRLAFFSTVSTFGTPLDITLAELSVEAFYPANARTANRLLGDVAGQ
jgi:transcriptional regulator with XRE-family HTH domain